MVPSRSRKTAGRREVASARSHLRGRKPASRRCFHCFRHHARHATVIDRAAPQEARAAVGFLLHDGAARRDWRGAMRICGAKNRDHRKAHRRSHVHRAGVVADKQLAAREERWEIGDRGGAHQTNRWTLDSGGNRVRNLLFGSGAEENHVRIRVLTKTIYKPGKTLRRPAFGRPVRRPSPNRNSCASWARTRSTETSLRPFAIFGRHTQTDKRLARQRIDPTRPPQKFEVIKLFVGRNFAALWNRNALRQQ